MAHEPSTHLSTDLRTMIRLAERRRFLGSICAATILPFIGCDDPSSSATGSSSDDSTEAPTEGATDETCATTPSETAGPYPGDGSNGPNALVLAGIVRRDIRSSLAGATGVADGIALTVRLTLVDTNGQCAPLAGHAIYLWHCDRDGAYSMYSSSAEDENYLRGLQATASDGTATFTTIFPGCYSGRMPHIHFEIYASLAEATQTNAGLHTSQLAFPNEVCEAAYATDAYAASLSRFNRTDFDSDNVFRDGVSLQMTTVTGNARDGFVADLTIGIAR